MIDETPIRARFNSVRSSLDERGGRSCAASEALSAGHGGIAAVARATNVSRSTIGRGLNDLRDTASLSGKVRRTGAGQPTLTAKNAALLEDLRNLLEPATMGDPTRLLRRVSNSHTKLAIALVALGHEVGKSSIPSLLEKLGYCRRVNR